MTLGCTCDKVKQTVTQATAAATTKTVCSDLDHGDGTIAHLVLDGDLVGHIQGGLRVSPKGHVVRHMLADSPWFALVALLPRGHRHGNHLNLKYTITISQCKILYNVLVNCCILNKEFHVQ